MENKAFVERYIYETKKNEVEWESSPNCNVDSYRCDSLFISKKENDIVAVGREEFLDDQGNSSEDEYYVFILDLSHKLLFTIDKNNISDSDDEQCSQFSPDDVFLISRLYRLAERSARKIDVLLQQLVTGISDPEDDLPL